MKKVFIGAVIGFSFLLTACGVEETPNEEENSAENEGQKEEKNENENWEERIKEIASSEQTETEKHDEVMLDLVNNYDSTEEEIKQFEEYIITEYESGNYLSDITNHEYMLTNLFKSGVVEEYYEDPEQNPMDSFAFDFLQNTKYTYRGVDAVDSESVKSNENQMDKILEEIQK